MGSWDEDSSANCFFGRRRKQQQGSWVERDRKGKASKRGRYQATVANWNVTFRENELGTHGEHTTQELGIGVFTERLLSVIGPACWMDYLPETFSLPHIKAK